MQIRYTRASHPGQCGVVNTSDTQTFFFGSICQFSATLYHTHYRCRPGRNSPFEGRDAPLAVREIPAYTIEGLIGGRAEMHFILATSRSTTDVR